MMANFCEEAFQVDGTVTIDMVDGRYLKSDFPHAIWKWLNEKPMEWASITVYDKNFDQSYGWDRYES